MLRTSITALVASVAYLATPAMAHAQQPSPEQIQQIYQQFVIAQRALGYNESCEVLDAASQKVAEEVTRGLINPLRRVARDKFKPDDIFEEARESFEGCKTREEAPQAWEIIDYTRKVGAANVVAPYLEGIDLSECTQSPFQALNLSKLEQVVRFTMRPYSKPVRDEIIAMAKTMQAPLKEACAVKPILGYDKAFRPTMAAATAVRQYRLTDDGAADESVETLEKGVEAKYWHAGHRTTISLSSPSGFSPAVGYRHYEDNPVAASVRLTIGKNLSLRGFLYLMRDRSIQARTTENYSEITLKEMGTGTLYPLVRTNPDEKPDFFRTVQAEYKMESAVLRKMVTSHDEDAEFIVIYRKEGEEVRKIFKRYDRDLTFRLGDFLRAAMWGSAPSGLDQVS